jgi:hypothetical protein
MPLPLPLSASATTGCPLNLWGIALRKGYRWGEAYHVLRTRSGRCRPLSQPRPRGIECPDLAQFIGGCGATHRRSHDPTTTASAEDLRGLALTADGVEGDRQRQFVAVVGYGKQKRGSIAEPIITMNLHAANKARISIACASDITM